MSSKEPGVLSRGTDSESVSLSRLQAELDEAGADTGTAVGDIVSEVDSTLFDGGFSFQEDRIKGSLDELLVMLAAVRSSETHGKRLIDDLDEEFDTKLSPATVYPRLHDLCDDGPLERRELVRTKEYTIEDGAAAHDTVASAMDCSTRVRQCSSSASRFPTNRSPNVSAPLATSFALWRKLYASTGL